MKPIARSNTWHLHGWRELTKPIVRSNAWQLTRIHGKMEPTLRPNTWMELTKPTVRSNAWHSKRWMKSMKLTVRSNDWMVLMKSTMWFNSWLSHGWMGMIIFLETYYEAKCLILTMVMKTLKDSSPNLLVGLMLDTHKGRCELWFFLKLTMRNIEYLLEVYHEV